MLQSLLSHYNAKIFKIAIFGFVSGMNLLLSGNTLNFWLASYEIDAAIIGIFSIVALPYAFKYLIALAIGSDKINFFVNKVSNYKMWLCISQVMLTLSLFLISLLNPRIDLVAIACCGILIATFSVITDIILNARRINIVAREIQPIATSMYTIGYRFGMIFSGAGVIYLSAMISWKEIFLIIAIIQFLLGLFLLITFTEKNDEFSFTSSSEEFSKELDIETIKIAQNQNKLYDLIVTPFKHLPSLKAFLWIIAFILFYRVGDNILTAMTNSFLLETGFNALEIASISKFFGTIMVIMGGLTSASIITKLGIRFSLISFSIMHFCGHFLYILMANIGKNTILLYFLTGYEAFTGGMMMIAYISFISGFCSGKYAGIQYALLSSGMGLSRSLFPILSGVVVNNFGWNVFFYFIMFLSLLTIIFLFSIPRNIFAIYHSSNNDKIL